MTNVAGASLVPSDDLCVAVNSTHVGAASLTLVPFPILVSMQRRQGPGVERAALKWHDHLALTSPNRCKVRAANVGLRQAQAQPTEVG